VRWEVLEKGEKLDFKVTLDKKEKKGLKVEMEWMDQLVKKASLDNLDPGEGKEYLALLDLWVKKVILEEMDMMDFLEDQASKVNQDYLEKMERLD
jgi:hypothetical protein